VLGKSPATVKNQVAACLRKLGVPTRTRLIALLR
jgi:DNA-binding NarL/FixJ family response regulator